MLRRRTLGNIVSENLHNPETDIADVYLKNGTEADYSGWSATQPIPVTGGRYLIQNKAYTLKPSDSSKRKYNFMYTVAGVYETVSYEATNYTDAVLNVPDGFAYIRLSDETSYLSNVEIYRLED